MGNPLATALLGIEIHRTLMERDAAVRKALLDRMAQVDRNDLIFGICPNLEHTIWDGHAACEAAADAVQTNVRQALAALVTRPGNLSADDES